METRQLLLISIKCIIIEENSVFFSPAVINILTESNLWRKELSLFTLPGHSPPLAEIKQELEAEIALLAY